MAEPISLAIRCPTTDTAVPTGIAMDFDSLRSAEMTGNAVACPACGQTHVWDKPKGETVAVVR